MVSHIDIAYHKDDISIANEINSRYERSAIDTQDLSSIVKYGLVHLEGFVKDKDESDTLSTIAQEIPGVKKVTSNLKIRDWDLD